MDHEVYWLAGLLEGEGSFMKGPPSAPNQPRISLQMIDEDVVKRVSNYFGLKYIQARNDLRNPQWKRAFGILIKGTKAIEFMKLIRPLMSLRRQGQIDTAIGSYVKMKRGPKPKVDTLQGAS